MGEMQDTVQVMAITAQVGGTTLTYGFRFLKATAIFVAKLLNTLYLAKWKGKASLRRFRAIKGDEMQFMCIHTEDKAKLRQIFHQMKRYGILTGRLPDLCQGDGMTQFVVSPTDMKKLEAFLQNHSRGGLRKIKIEPIRAMDYQKTGYDPSGQPTKELKELEASARKHTKSEAVKDPPGKAEAKVKTLQQEAKKQEARRPGMRELKLEPEAKLFQYSDRAAFALPGSPYAVVIPNTGWETGSDGKLRLFVNPNKNYFLIDKRTRGLSRESGAGILARAGGKTYRQQKAELVVKQMGEQPKILKVSLDQPKELFSHSRAAALSVPGSPYAVVLQKTCMEPKEGGTYLYLRADESYVTIHKKTQELKVKTGAQLAREFTRPSYQKQQESLARMLEHTIQRIWKRTAPGQPHPLKR